MSRIKKHLILHQVLLILKIDYNGELSIKITY